MKTRMYLAGIAVLASAATAHADNFVWDWNSSMNATNNSSGQFETIHAEFNNVTNRFVWNVVFADQVTEGYTLAVNSGPNPKGHGGELALLYFDATNTSNAKVTAYAYNGENLSNSWNDGNGVAPGNQAPDLIHGLYDSGWILNKSVQDLAGGKRAFNLTIDATSIQNHSPAYPADSDNNGVNDWTGVAFGPEQIGLWMHTYTGLTTGYNPSGNGGGLCGWDFCGQGWFDGGQIVLVPLPTTALMGTAGLGLVGFAIRRRNAAHKA